MLRERQMAKHGGSKMHLIGTQPPYQLWSKEDVEAGARKAAQRAALLPKRPPVPISAVKAEACLPACGPTQTMVCWMTARCGKDILYDGQPAGSPNSPRQM